ncbi:unnamed protein product [Effrenium voratum]|uniref:Uncharacterized protein n=1 Tax=Effrenium voratum TaxID=2562239 RepID=A0AA36MII7_9DINO|nr:unnamed protein product [Effrenium voratum]CAJ1447915.1 unnamed protein product [Effrenium voratum]
MWNQGGQAEFVHQAQQLWQHAAQHAGDQSMPHAADVAAAWQRWADALFEGAGRVAHDLVLPAYAAEVALDPNTTYLYGADGAVLVDPMNNKPISDDWWNGFIGFQSELIKSIDAKLREVGVEQAFGWTIALYTAIKLLFFPLQQSPSQQMSRRSEEECLQSPGAKPRNFGCPFHRIPLMFLGLWIGGLDCWFGV